MATTTPNYGWDVPTSTDYVKDGATAIETLGDDIDASLFSITGGKNVGHQFISATSFTTASTVTIDNVFTSAYQDYLITLDLDTVSGTDNHTLKMRVGGTTPVVNLYYYNAVFQAVGSSTVSGTFGSGTAGFQDISRCDSGAAAFASITISKPQETKRTHVQAFATDTSVWRMYGGHLGNNVSYDGFQWAPNSGTATGTIRVYGLRKS